MVTSTIALDLHQGLQGDLAYMIENAINNSSANATTVYGFLSLWCLCRISAYFRLILRNTFCGHRAHFYICTLLRTVLLRIPTSEPLQ